MAFNIPIRHTTLSKIGELDFDNLPFGQIYTDHMFVAEYYDGAWQEMSIQPLDTIALHPGTLSLHYGQAIFEGMKATKHINGDPLLFRPYDHAKRFNKSAERMCMPEVPEDLYVEAVYKLVQLEQDWIPPLRGSALYIRPFMFATDTNIGVHASEKYKFIIMTLPVGPYYARPVSLYADKTHVRAIEGGVGEAKAAGNYAASLLPAKLANEKGYDQVLWLDGREFKYVQEVGTMNIFFVIGDKVITPATDGAILKGLTRDSVIQILRKKGNIVVERPISIDEIVEASKAGELKEAFGTGTAAVIAPVNRIHIDGTDYHVDSSDTNLGSYAKSKIEMLKDGSEEDVYDWIMPVRTLEQV